MGVVPVQYDKTGARVPCCRSSCRPALLPVGRCPGTCCRHPYGVVTDTGRILPLKNRCPFRAKPATKEAISPAERGAW